jgi:hypothetical protein
MSLRYFTVPEANALLPELEPLVGRVLALRARASHHSREMGALLADLSSDVGGPLPSRLTGEFAEIEDLIERIQAYGVVLKSLEAGLLDFLCERDGRDVFLCWRYGEAAVQYYHELHTGYQGRRPL